MLNFTPKELSRTVGIHTIKFIMCGGYKIARDKLSLSAVDGEILLLPVRARHFETART